MNTPYRQLIIFITLILSITLSACSYKALLPKGPDITSPQTMQVGKGHFVMNAYTDSNLKTIRVWTFKPVAWQQGDRVLYVMHGMSRDAENYLDLWIDIAEQNNILLIAPEFHQKFYKYTTIDYQDGNLFNLFGNRNPETQTAFQVIDNITTHINKYNPFNISSYDMFGHSAGSQFVHRMVLLHPNNQINTAIAANAGVYTFPDVVGHFPYGLPDGAIDLSHAFQQKLVVMLGENDSNAIAGKLDQSAQAMRQGEHRLARGQKFFKTAQAMAMNNDQEFNWQLKLIPNVGHQKRGMIQAAADFLCGSEKQK